MFKIFLELLGISTSLASLRVAPVVIITFGALSTAEAELFKGLNWIEALRVLLELWPGQGFDFL